MSKKAPEVSLSDWKGDVAIIKAGKNVEIEFRDGTGAFYIPKDVGHQFVAKINFTGKKFSELPDFTRDAVGAMSALEEKARKVYPDHDLQVQDHGIATNGSASYSQVLFRLFPKKSVTRKLVED